MARPSQVISIDAPIDGWNAFDSVDNMPPTSAIILDNLIPSAGTVDTRKGTSSFADTSTSLPVETLASLDTDTTSLLIAASNGGFWDITVEDTVTQLAAATTYSNDRWQTQNFTTLSEEGVLILCNGEDDAIKLASPYTAMATIDFTELVGEAQVPIDGDFIGVVMFKGRCYYWYDNDDAFWYSQAGSYQGQMTEFNLGTVAKKGGKIKFITTWTQQDSGDGKDDFIVFVMSTGEVLIYQGDDPESVGFFEMVGRYIVAEPMSIRGHASYGSDTIIMTKDGYVALSTIVQQGRISDVPAFSRLISGAIADRTETRSDFFGWDATLHAKDGLFIFNVPLSTLTYEQHVLNTITQRWCRFKDINVSCMVVHDDRLFGGKSDGTVIAISEGTDDEGSSINFVGLPAFNYFDDSGNNKMLSAAQIFSTHANPELIDLRGYSDFNLPYFEPVAEPVLKGDGRWSINPATPPDDLGSYWDEDYWSAPAITTKGWQNVSAYGTAITILVRFNKVNESVKWRSTTMRFNYSGAQ